MFRATGRQAKPLWTAPFSLPDAEQEVDARVSAMLFHSAQLPQFDFNQYAGRLDLVPAALQSMQYPSERNFGTALGAAANYAVDNLLVEEAGRRGDNPALVFILTDGKSLESDRTVVTAAQRLQATGAKIIVLGITDEVDAAQLKVVAGPDENVFLLSDFAALNPSLIASLGTQFACEEERTTVEPPPCNPDVVVVMDVSGSVGQDNFDLTIDFVKEVTGGLPGEHLCRCAPLELA